MPELSTLGEEIYDLIEPYLPAAGGGGARGTAWPVAPWLSAIADPAWDLTFDDGNPDIAAHGWTIKCAAAVPGYATPGVTLTRQGDVVRHADFSGSNTYRSTVVNGALLIQLPPGSVLIYRTQTDPPGWTGTYVLEGNAGAVTANLQGLFGAALLSGGLVFPLNATEQGGTVSAYLLTGNRFWDDGFWHTGSAEHRNGGGIGGIGNYQNITGRLGDKFVVTYASAGAAGQACAYDSASGCIVWRADDLPAGYSSPTHVGIFLGVWSGKSGVPSSPILTIKSFRRSPSV